MSTGDQNYETNLPHLTSVWPMNGPGSIGFGMDRHTAAVNRLAAALEKFNEASARSSKPSIFAR